MQAHSLSNRAATPTAPSPPPGEAWPESIADGLGLAHDAGNLLAALRLYTDLLARPGVLRPEHAHYAREIRLLTDRTSAWIGRLLAPLNENILAEAPFAVVDGAAVLRSLEPLLRRVAQPCATVTVRVAAGLPPLPFSTDVLERVVLNLVRNAAEAISTMRGRAALGEIAVALHVFAERLELIVQDDGPGMQPVPAARLVGGTAVRSRHSARGLGHAIVHELARSSGAAIEVRVSPGRGTAITLSWPLSRDLMSATQKTGVAC